MSSSSARRALDLAPPLPVGAAAALLAQVLGAGRQRSCRRAW